MHHGFVCHVQRWKGHHKINCEDTSQLQEHEPRVKTKLRYLGKENLLQRE